MNPNYATFVKQDLDKLLAANFIELIEQATWLSPIVVVPKKNGKSSICIDFRKLNTITKDPYHYPSLMRFWTRQRAMKCTHFWMVFQIPSNSNCLRRPLQHNIHYGLGSVCVGGNAIWTQECTTHLPKEQ